MRNTTLIDFFSTRTLITVSISCLLLSDAVEYMSTTMQIHLDATTIMAVLKLVSLLSLVIIARRLRWQPEMPQWGLLLFRLSILCNTVTIVRGFITAEDYWDWKYISLYTSFALWVQMAVLVGILYEDAREIMRLIVTRLFLFGFIAIPLTLKIDTEQELFARGMMISVCFFILASPYFEKKWRWLVFLVAATAVYIAYDFRTNVIRIVVCYLIIGLYYARKYITVPMLRAVCLSMLLIPPVLLYLGVTDKFNVFKPAGDDIEKFEFDYASGKQSNAAIDTRTFLYEEVFRTLKQRNSFLLGEGGSGKYTTEYFDESVDQNKGRYGSEVGFLNTLLYSGIVGVLLYGALLFCGAYFAINQSNNFFCKMLGIFLCFRWVLFFIEDFTAYNMNNYLIWVAVGFCLSKRFRSLQDHEIASYFDFKKSRVPRAVVQEQVA